MPDSLGRLNPRFHVNTVKIDAIVHCISSYHFQQTVYDIVTLINPRYNVYYFINANKLLRSYNFFNKK